jgi:23S rRNA (cytosine1962-C5)-methyltransferase
MALLVSIPCILHEDDHLLVVNKPPGISTHSPSPFSGEGIYEWLRHQEPRWASLAIMHRLDKETSGVLLFSKTALANRSLTGQFTGRQVLKRYRLLTDRPVEKEIFKAVSFLMRAGEKYQSRPEGRGGERAETRFRCLERRGGETLLEAEPVTGRTHQVRVHASENGFPILGDLLYEGTPAPRLCLHARELAFAHPASNQLLEVEAAEQFSLPSSLLLRELLIDPEQTDAFRLWHGAADSSHGNHLQVRGKNRKFSSAVHQEICGTASRFPTGAYLDRLGDFLLCQSEQEPDEETGRAFEQMIERFGCRAVYFKRLTRQVRRASAVETSPRLWMGSPALPNFRIRENGISYELSFQEGYSVGLFLDQRENRRRFLRSHVAAGFPLQFSNETPEVLNAFAYTCAFSVCAARGGARVTSIDLSRKYLEWGKRNFQLNHLDPEAHEFIYGDVFNWLKRLGKRNRTFDAIILDPPTFSQSKQSGIFRAERDLGGLVQTALPLLRPQGVLLVSTNAASLKPERFMSMIEQALRVAGRRRLKSHYVPQPFDFPITRHQPAYLKTIWLQVE